jgi:membrane protease subunit (stomatin/prohibitin family)
MSFFNRMGQASRDQYIARPDDIAGRLIWRYPNQNIVNGAKCTVRSDEEVLFFREGRLVGCLGAGSYELSSQNVPFFLDLITGPLSGGNQYIAEIFFVRKAEYLFKLEDRDLGAMRDLESRLLVHLSYDARLGLSVKDPVALIVELGGQDSNSEDRALELLGSRITSALRSVVGKLTMQVPVLDITSNAHSDEIGQQICERISPEFSNQGLAIQRFLELDIKLSDESRDALSEYGSQQANLNISSRGAQIASHPGFQSFQLAQGQRAALEGLGAGLASGSLQSPILGLNLGAAPLPPRQILLTPSTGPSVMPVFSSPPFVMADGRERTVGNFFMETSRGEEGPYKARQIALRILADQLDPKTARVRGESDVTWFPAYQEPSIRAEIERRVPRASEGSKTQKTSYLETLFSAALEDGLISRDELRLLVSAFLNEGLGTSPEQARDAIIQRALRCGCRVEELANSAPPVMVVDGTSRPPPRLPPPPPQRLFTYFDGVEQVPDLAVAAIRERIAAKPNLEHWVWRDGMAGWKLAQELPEFEDNDR